MIVTSHKWPGTLARFWVPSVQDIYDGGPKLAVIASAHVGLAVLIRAIEYAHGAIEGADNDDLVAMTGEITDGDELVAVEIVRQARTLAGLLRAYARERKHRRCSSHEALDDPF